MDSSVIISGLLCLLFSSAVPMCTPTDYTLYVEKPECDFCVAINTTICTGFCYSWDSNVKDWDRLGQVGQTRSLFQRGCAYDRVEYHTAVLPGCPADTNPLFTYPVALSCHCGSCKTKSEECAERTSGGTGARCTKELRHIYPRNYMIPF